MGANSTSRARRIVSLMLVCLPLVAASPAVAMVADNHPVVLEAYNKGFDTQPPSQPTLKPNVERTLRADATPQPTSTVADSGSGGIAAPASGALAVALLGFGGLLVVRRRRRPVTALS